jgi:glycerol dehydrogenase-like iron-containing ADH family enzyme
MSFKEVLPLGYLPICRREGVHPHENPELVLVDTGLITRAPVRFLLAIPLFKK